MQLGESVISAQYLILVIVCVCVYIRKCIRNNVCFQMGSVSWREKARPRERMVIWGILLNGNVQDTGLSDIAL